MTGCKSEKQEAFAHTDLLCCFGMRLTGNAADADELVQATYLKAYQFLGQVRSGDKHSRIALPNPEDGPLRGLSSWHCEVAPPSREKASSFKSI
jgi:hypothetical protein